MISRTTVAAIALLSLGACQGLVPSPTVPSPAPVPSTPIPSVSSVPSTPSTSDVPSVSSMPSEVSSAPESSVPVSSAPEAKTYTMAEVAAHATPEDCWFVIAGTVYDVTGFGAKHGGGDAVYEGCGTDATTLFETRPMGSGTPHSEKARGFLPNFEIGKLAQ